MRILQVIQKKQLRGAEIFASQLSIQLREMGHEVMVMALEDGTADFVLPEVVVVNANPSKIFDYGSWKTIAVFVHEWKPDIIQANASDTLRYCIFSKKLFGWKTPVIYRNANLISGFMNNSLKRSYYKWLFRSVTGVASVSMNCLNDFKKVFNWENGKIAYLPIGVNSPFPAAYTSLDEAGVKVDAKQVFINCAALMPEKNHSGLIRIFKKIHAVLPNSVLMIYGRGPLKEQLQAEINALGLRQVILIQEPRADIIRILPLCSALIMPSLIEGLPGIILEAFVCELPVFANSVGGIPEVIRHGETGWLSEVDNEEQMANLVVGSISDSDLIKSVTQQARVIAESRFSNKKIAKSFEEFYNTIIQ